MTLYNSIFDQLGSFFFLLAAIFNDVILIRLTLVLGNFFLLLNAALGWPMWPNVISEGVQWDSLAWAGSALVLHLYAFTLLLMDERRLRRFTDDNCEAIYQFWRRRSGIGRRDFLHILLKGHWTKIPLSGTSIDCDANFHIIVDGKVEALIEGWRRTPEDVNYLKEPFITILASGDVFDLRLCNIFDAPIGFFNNRFKATTVTNDVLLFSFSLEALVELATKSPQVVMQSWRNLIMFAVADIAHRPWKMKAEEPDSRPSARHPDFTISKVEEPTFTFTSFALWFVKSKRRKRFR